MFVNAMPEPYCLADSQTENAEEGYGLLHIPSWIRAPLSFSSRNSGYFFWNNYPSQRADAPPKDDDFWVRRLSREIIFTPFHPRHWPDMWRIDIQVRDAAGLYRDLVEIFDRFKIRVIAEDSRNTFVPEFHVKSFMVDCTEYSSEVDGDTDARRVPNSAISLQGLHDFLLLKFLSKIRIANSHTPRLTIRRNFAYQNLAVRAGALVQHTSSVEYEWFDQTNRAQRPLHKIGTSKDPSLPHRRKDVKWREADQWLAKHDWSKDSRSGPVYVEIPNTLPRIYQIRDGAQIDEALESESAFRVMRSHYYAFAVNVRSRLGYCRVIPSSQFERYFHFLFYQLNGKTLERILTAFKKQEINILRSQLAPGILGLSWIENYIADNDEDQKRRLDQLKEHLSNERVKLGSRPDQPHNPNDRYYTINIFGERRSPLPPKAVERIFFDELSDLLDGGRLHMFIANGQYFANERLNDGDEA